KWTSSSLPGDLTGLTFQVAHPDYAPALYATEGYASPPTNTVTTFTSSSSSSSVTYRRLADGTLVPMTQPRRSTSRSQSLPLLGTNALLASSAEMTLQPALLLEGTIVDSEGKPLPVTEVIVQ